MFSSRFKDLKDFSNSLKISYYVNRIYGTHIGSYRSFLYYFASKFEHINGLFSRIFYAGTPEEIFEDIPDTRNKLSRFLIRSFLKKNDSITKKHSFEQIYCWHISNLDNINLTKKSIFGCIFLMSKKIYWFNKELNELQTIIQAEEELRCSKIKFCTGLKRLLYRIH